MDIWRKEGKYVDLWSALHVLSGAMLGFFPRYFGFGMMATFFIVFLLLVMYEMFEVIVKIEEFPTNRVTDVVFGMVGFTPVYLFDQTLPGSTSMILAVMVTTADVLVSIVAWTSSYKAFALEEKLRNEVVEQRQKFLARRERRQVERLRRRALRTEH
jgi:hypothetical protein